MSIYKELMGIVLSGFGLKRKSGDPLMSMTIKRVCFTPAATFGVIINDGEPFAVTLELPYRNNIPEESCIEKGIYLCKRVESPRFGETFEVKGVSGRSYILFHKGNVPADTRGCILIGEQFEQLKDQLAVLQSQKGFTEFMSRLEGKDNFMLEIKEC